MIGTHPSRMANKTTARGSRRDRAWFVVSLLTGAAALSVLGGCRSFGAFSERVADDARFWGDQTVAYILGDDPSKD
ncbi:MAG TPA: hypothetical protein ENK11_06560 [Phycisphaerales bacterium]|nr:hypothetical protein [Phycisphaerales bacterium]